MEAIINAILNFFSDLILFTAGLAVVTIWIFIFIGIWVEFKDTVAEFRNRGQSTTPDEDDWYAEEMNR